MKKKHKMTFDRKVYRVTLEFNFDTLQEYNRELKKIMMLKHVIKGIEITDV